MIKTRRERGDRRVYRAGSDGKRQSLRNEPPARRGGSGPGGKRGKTGRSRAGPRKAALGRAAVKLAAKPQVKFCLRQSEAPLCGVKSLPAGADDCYRKNAATGQAPSKEKADPRLPGRLSYWICREHADLISFPFSKSLFASFSSEKEDRSFLTSSARRASRRRRYRGRRHRSRGRRGGRRPRR